MKKATLILFALASLQPALGMEPEKDLNAELNVAAWHGNIKTVQQLLKIGARINARDKANGSTPLIQATLQSHEIVVRFLLANGADVNLPDSEGATPLMAAAECGNLAIASLLIDRNAHINAQTYNRECSALYYAAQDGHDQIIELLLDHGADIDSPNVDGATSLTPAAQNGHLNAVAILLRHGANPNKQTGQETLYSPLLLAVRGGHHKIAQQLLKRGAHINLQDVQGFTPLIDAAKNRSHKLVAMLLESQRNANVNVILLLRCLFRLKKSDPRYNNLYRNFQTLFLPHLEHYYVPINKLLTMQTNRGHTAYDYLHVTWLKANINRTNKKE